MPSFKILGLDHVVLRTTDPARLERFYVDKLGCTLERRNPAFKLTQLRAGSSLIDLVEAETGGEGRNMDHYCLRIEPFDGEAIRRDLIAAGIDCDPAKSRYGADGQGPSIYFRDPDGNRVEIKGPPE